MKQFKSSSRNIAIFCFSLFLSLNTFAGGNEESKIDTVLSNLHQFAAEANGEAYFNLYTDDAIYMGTDAGERWTIGAFKQYAMPYFNKGKGWVYIKRNRNITLSKDHNTAWFDEILDSKSYGTSRGTGVLVKTAKGWKVSQYHLTFPIPNDLAKDFTQKIIKFEANSN